MELLFGSKFMFKPSLELSFICNRK